MALRLHHWNAAVAGSLMPTIYIAEVVIRNFAMRRLIAHIRIGIGTLASNRSWAVPS